MRNPEVGRRIREVRQRLNFTQPEFGRQLGVKKLSVVRYEAGGVSRLDILRRIAHVGGVTLAWLLEGEGPLMAHEMHPNAPEQQVPAPLNSLVDRLRTELTNDRVAQLPPSRRTRYENRAKEVLAWAQRELGEYHALLRAEARTLRTSGRR